TGSGVWSAQPANMSGSRGAGTRPSVRRRWSGPLPLREPGGRPLACRAMRKIVVFGAGGRAGRRVVAEAAARGHAVTAVARTPYPAVAGGRVTVVAGDVTDEASVAAAAAGHDAAITTAARLDVPGVDFYTAATRAGGRAGSGGRPAARPRRDRHGAGGRARQAGARRPGLPVRPARVRARPRGPAGRARDRRARPGRARPTAGAPRRDRPHGPVPDGRDRRAARDLVLLRRPRGRARRRGRVAAAPPRTGRGRPLSPPQVAPGDRPLGRDELGRGAGEHDPPAV